MRWGALLSLSLLLAALAPAPEAWAQRARRGSSGVRLAAPPADAELPAGAPVTFAWRATGRSFHLEVARDADFSDTVVNRWVKRPSAEVQLEPGTYYWRVTLPRRTPSDVRTLVVAEPPGATAAAQAPASPEMGLDLSAPAPPPAEAPVAEAPVEPAAEPPAVEQVTEPVGDEDADEAPRRRAAGKAWNVFIGGSGSLGLGGPVSNIAGRYEAGVGFRVARPLELSLAVGGGTLALSGDRDATWPFYKNNGFVYVDLSGRYRLTNIGTSALYALLSARYGFFTAKEEQRGFLGERDPYAVGAGLGYRFRAGLPMELGLRANKLFGTEAGAEAELYLRVLVF